MLPCTVYVIIGRTMLALKVLWCQLESQSSSQAFRPLASQWSVLFHLCFANCLTSGMHFGDCLGVESSDIEQLIMHKALFESASLDLP